MRNEEIKTLHLLALSSLEAMGLKVLEWINKNPNNEDLKFFNKGILDVIFAYSRVKSEYDDLLVLKDKYKQDILDLQLERNELIKRIAEAKAEARFVTEINNDESNNITL